MAQPGDLDTQLADGWERAGSSEAVLTRAEVSAGLRQQPTFTSTLLYCLKNCFELTTHYVTETHNYRKLQEEKKVD